jgi:hypothetical protein
MKINIFTLLWFFPFMNINISVNAFTRNNILRNNDNNNQYKKQLVMPSINEKQVLLNSNKENIEEPLLQIID